MEKKPRDPYKIHVVSNSYDPKPKEIINVQITTDDPLDAVAIAANVIKTMKELCKEPEIKIQP